MRQIAIVLATAAALLFVSSVASRKPFLAVANAGLFVANLFLYYVLRSL